jgi:hypothetical protein
MRVVFSVIYFLNEIFYTLFSMALYLSYFKTFLS